MLRLASASLKWHLSDEVDDYRFLRVGKIFRIAHTEWIKNFLLIHDSKGMPQFSHISFHWSSFDLSLNSHECFTAAYSFPLIISQSFVFIISIDITDHSLLKGNLRGHIASTIRTISIVEKSPKCLYSKQKILKINRYS